MEKEIKNKIIAISGEPVSGKGTTVKALVNQLKEQGYPEENIHLKATGDEFREYFGCVINFIQNINDFDTLKKIGKTEVMQKILKNGEYRKVLSNTIAQIQKSNIDLTQFKIADANNASQFSHIRKVIDKLIDENIKQLGLEINKKLRDNELWIIDSRLAFHNIPSAFSIRLTTNPNEAAKRLLNDKSRSGNDRYSSLDEAKKERERRKEGEKERYKKRYGVDLEDVDNYDLIIDTSYSSVDDIADTILECQKLYEEGKKYGKMWRKPQNLVTVAR